MSHRALYTLNEAFPHMFFIAGGEWLPRLKGPGPYSETMHGRGNAEAILPSQGLFDPGVLPAPMREAFLRNLEKWEHKYEHAHYSLEDNGGF